MKKLSFLKSSATRILSHVDIIHPDVGAQHDFPAAENIEGNQKILWAFLSIAMLQFPFICFHLKYFSGKVSQCSSCHGCHGMCEHG